MSLNNQYILEISRGHASKRYPLNGIFEKDQAKAIHSLGEKVIMASVDTRSIRRWRRWGIYTLMKDGLKIYNISFPMGRLPIQIQAFIVSKCLKVLYKVIVAENGPPKLMHAHFIVLGSAAASLKEFNKIPLVITEHSSYLNVPRLKRGVKKVAEFAYQHADCLVVVSSSLRNRIREHFLIDAVVVGNIVEQDIFPYKEKHPKPMYTFISIGNLIYGKGFDILIDAFQDAFKNVNDVELIIYGEGIKRKQITKKVKSYKLEDRIFLNGRTSREHLASELHKSDCFVLASRGETFGVVYIESLATGTPVIGTLCGGPEDFISVDNGIVVSNENERELAEALRIMYLRKRQYNGKKISQEVYDKFSSEKIAEKLLQIFNSVIRENCEK